MIAIGKLDRRITVQRRVTTTDDYGQELNSWTDIATVWANIRPIGGRERLAAMAIESTLTHTVAVRYQAQFMPPVQAGAWRIQYVTPVGTRIFGITSGRDLDEGRRHIVFDCTEGNPVGQ